MFPDSWFLEGVTHRHVTVWLVDFDSNVGRILVFLYTNGVSVTDSATESLANQHHFPINIWEGNSDQQHSHWFQWELTSEPLGLISFLDEAHLVSRKVTIEMEISYRVCNVNNSDQRRKFEFSYLAFLIWSAWFGVNSNMHWLSCSFSLFWETEYV